MGSAHKVLILEMLDKQGGICRRQLRFSAAASSYLQAATSSGSQAAASSGSQAAARRGSQAAASSGSQAAAVRLG